MNANSNSAGQENSEPEEFTLRSNFAKRTSHFASVTESEMMKRDEAEPVTQINTQDDEEIADIEETLRVIDSARRFLKTGGSTTGENTDKTFKQCHTDPDQNSRIVVGENMTCHQSSIQTLSNSRSSYKPTFGMLRDMSKETLKHHSSIDEKAEPNANDVTQEVFRDELQEVTAK